MVCHIVAEKKKRKTKSLFPKSSTADNRGKAATQQDCIDLATFVFSTGQFVFHVQFRQSYVLYICLLTWMGKNFIFLCCQNVVCGKDLV